MSWSATPRHASARLKAVERWAVSGLFAAGLLFLLAGFVVFHNVRKSDRDAETVHRSAEAIIALDAVLADLQDAETGQRGYLLTGDERYLDPYDQALARIDVDIDRLDQLSDPEQAHMASLRRHIRLKLAELRQTIALRRSQGLDAALAVVRTDRGQDEMDAAREEFAAIRLTETERREALSAGRHAAARQAWISGVVLGFLGLSLTGVIGLLLRQGAAARERRDWLQEGQVELSTHLLGEQTIAQLGEAILGFLAEFLGARSAACYVRGGGGQYDLLRTYGVPAGAAVVDRIEPGEGLLGRVLQTSAPLRLAAVPAGYLAYGSALGQATPAALLIVPLHAEGVIYGVVEFGFDGRSARADRLDGAETFLAQATQPCAVSLRAARYREDLAELLAQTQQQAEELQVQGEELRVSNEELEEQGRALRESTTRLEHQQAELEQNNSQLAGQAVELERQRDGIAQQKGEIERKAAELEQAGRYKSDFLANMSHELRTPLNSLLILSRLLAENPNGRLSDDQVKYARTIEASGNDLLELINDILDLSKIEAGHVAIRPQEVSIERIFAALQPMFAPMAESKGLALGFEISPGCPARMVSDPQRLEQVLRNLLSNALKFTEHGSVRLRAEAGEGATVRLSVIDTGIGIPAEQAAPIFEAFHQADASISRRYGGTGLGLSISRELVWLLGGTIALDSAPGRGSTFCVTLPLTPAETETAAVAEGAPPEPPTPIQAAVTATTTTTTTAPAPLQGSDGRPASRCVMVVEDDATFAAILQDRAHQLGFDCVVSTTAGEALAMAHSRVPDAIVLDVGLPDQSGLSVLDRLKRDARTRHIPIHVVSGGDHARTALSLGAAGYVLKPVRPEELARVFADLDRRLNQAVRRVLIVEDDAVQREAVSELLRADDVQTIAVGTVAACLAELEGGHFDCMVLDLRLPDASGFTLLETLSASTTHGFPPVIVYTGRELSDEEEQRLRRMSRSIIIKGARSPERLLDEVALFLHQVVSDLPPERQSMIRQARHRDAILEGRRILIVEDDVRNVFALTNVIEPHGALVEIARNGEEAIAALERARATPERAIDLVLMDVMMPVMDGLTAMREIRRRPYWAALPMIALTAKAMPDDQERCIAAGASDYIAKPLDVERLLSLLRVWMPRERVT